MRYRYGKLLLVGLQMALPTAGSATILQYGLQSPSFGGTNSYNLTMAQTISGLKANALALKKQQDAAAAAAAQTQNSTANAFANSVVSQLNGLVAYKIASQIANSSPNTAQTFISGNSTVSYKNVGGILTITISNPTGTTTLQLPSL